jgi:O-antigen/teichoic acid export membrane protein
VRTKQSLLSLAAQEALTGVAVLVGFVATPLLLRWLGDLRFGAYEAASDWFGYAALLEFGITGALYPLLAGSVAKGDRSMTYKTLVAGVRAYAVSALLMVCAGLGVACLITRLIPVGGALAGDLRTGAWIGIAAFTLLPFSAFRALAEAAQRAYLVSGLLIVQSLIITGVSLLLAWVGWGITGQFLASLVGAVFFSVVLAWKGMRLFPGAVGAAFRGAADSDASRALRQLSWPSFVFNLCGRLNFMTDKIIVARMLTPAAVVPFFVTQRLALLAQGELQGVGNSTWAGLAELHHQALHRRFNQRLLELTKLVAILAAACLVPITVYNHRFVAMWVGASRFGGTVFSAVAAINAMLLAVFSLWGWCINGLGQVRRTLPGLTAQSCINVVFSVILTRRFGIIGPLLGTTIAFATISIWYLPWLLKTLFGTDINELVEAIAIPAASAVPYLLAVGWFEGLRISNGWIGMALEMSTCALFYVAACWALLLDGEDRALWKQRIRLIMEPLVR